ncbi:M3 family metallopeptidase [Xanthomonas campestris]|uniref:M3 family metallopeptidase n=1 Tax=Xanthomonas campestris TaxID=339 RepID=UPI0023E9C5C2|nr:oligoendopeptidase F [Xanthomonas campestris]
MSIPADPFALGLRVLFQCGVGLALLSSTDVRAADAAQQDYAADEHAFFASAKAERAQREGLAKSLALSKVSPQSSDPSERFSNFEKLFGKCLRHHAYYELLSSRNTQDAQARKALNEVDDLCEIASSEARGVLLSSPSSEAWTQPYAFLRARAERARDHKVSVDQQAAFDALSDQVDQLSRAYREILQAVPFESVETGQKRLNAFVDNKTLMSNPDGEVRAISWRAYWDGVNSQSERLGQTLIGIVRSENAMAALRGYRDAPEAHYAAMGLTRDEVTETLAQVESHVSAWQAYQTVKGDKPWDMSAPVGSFAHHLTVDQLRQVATRAVAPLGKHHAEELSRVLDAREQRMDLSSEIGSRAKDAFSITAPEVPSVLYVGYRRDDLESDVELIHEAAHAVHGQLMNDAQTSPLTRNGPSWMIEAFAILDELLLREQLAKEAKTPQAREFYLRSLLDDIALQIFTSAEEAQLERDLYDSQAAGTLQSAADLSRLTTAVLQRYERWPQAHPELAETWATKRLFYEDPMYLTNYLYAGLVAVKLFELSHEHKAEFASQYRSLEEQGFGQYPTAALEKVLGGKVDWSRLVDEDADFFNRQVRLLNQ